MNNYRNYLPSVQRRYNSFAIAIISAITLLAAACYLTANIAIAARSYVRQTDPQAQDNQPAIAELASGKPIEREIKGEQVDSYKIKLAANQYLNLVVAQNEIDVMVEVYDPDGKQIYQIDSCNIGPEPILQLSI